MSASMMQPNLDQLAGLTGVRAGALTRWQETGWPNSRVEQWRFTRLASLEKMDRVRLLWLVVWIVVGPKNRWFQRFLC